jgi:hypothetical protein
MLSIHDLLSRLVKQSLAIVKTQIFKNEVLIYQEAQIDKISWKEHWSG